MPRTKRSDARHHTTIQLSSENNQWLEETKAATGRSRSDTVNEAIAALRDEGRLKQLLREVLAEDRDR